MTLQRVVAVSLLTITLLGTGAACATANGGAEKTDASQTQTAGESESTKAAFGVRKPKHVGVTIMTAHEMLEGKAELPADEIAIVACGPAIGALAKDSDHADAVRGALEADIGVKACGLTVERKGFDEEKFIDGVEVVPNGFVELIRLQKQGFYTVEL